MKTLVACGTLILTAFALFFLSTAWAADEGPGNSKDLPEAEVMIETKVNLTRKSANGKTEATAYPTVRSLLGQAAKVEMTLPNGESVTISIVTKQVTPEAKETEGSAGKQAD